MSSGLLDLKMRCSAYCTDKEYHMANVFENLAKADLNPKYFDTIIHIEKKFENSSKSVDLFFFPFGCSVIWSATKVEEDKVLLWLKTLPEFNMQNPAVELIYHKVDPSIKKGYINEEDNEIVLPEPENATLLKISVSYALAQSAKLSTLEGSIAQLIQSTSVIQEELSVSGSVSLSKKEITKQMGALYYQRYQVNIHNEILDTPEFFWRRPSYEPIYLLAAEFQDIAVRQGILNKRLDVIYELYNMLSTELNHMHSSKMEMIIIALITIEVVTAITGNFGMFEKIISFFVG